MRNTALILFAAATLIVLSCEGFDDSAIREELDRQEDLIQKLETECSRLNTNISSLQSIVSALEKEDYITSVIPVYEGGETIGYTITFASSTPITIYHGVDGKDGADGADGTPGKDGYTPNIGVAKDTDGIYYWTLDGNWLLDSAGNKIKAEGTDGSDGADGKPGEDGYSPNLGVAKDTDGVYYWTLDGDWLLDSEGNKIKAEGTDGADGADGKPGADGENGADGKDGHSPVIGVAKDTDGIYYWTLDGYWMTDSDGNKIRANGKDGQPGADGEDGADGAPGADGADGKDGITPQLKIEDGYWHYSYDGTTWTRLYQAVGSDGADGKDGDSIFKSVTYDDEYVYFTLIDGTSITLPRSKSAGSIDRTALTGIWAAIDDGQLCTEYIKFDHLATRFTAQEQYLAHEKTIWRVEDGDFKYKDSRIIDISGKTVYLDGSKWGEVSFDADTMFVSGKKYLKVDDFSEDYYDSLKDISKKSFTYYCMNTNLQEIEFEADNTLPPFVKLMASSQHTWIKNSSYKNNVLSFSLLKTSEIMKRIGKIEIEYPGFKGVSVEIIQTDIKPHIELSNDSYCFPCQEVEFICQYTIVNPTDDKLTVSSSLSWMITDMKISDKYIAGDMVDVESPWSGTITLSYGSAVKRNIEIGRYMDLSTENGSANCYIINRNNYSYCFRTVKGNSSESVGEVAGVRVLWSSFGTDKIPAVGDLITNLSYSNGYIFFKSDTKIGNAVIAAMDSEGTILWSWHMWCAAMPEDQIYDNDAGVMMDRNLGATTDTPGHAGALGLLYQWGRKDPFLGSSSISSSTTAKSTITWPSAVSSSSSYGTIDYATEHPTTFIKYNNSNYDWYYTGSSSTDNTRWQSSKTIYDPCPAGYRVPDGGSSGVWSKAFGTSSYFEQDAYDSANEGFNFGSSVSTKKLTSSSSTCWYPAAGCLNYNDGSLSDVGDDGRYWSCSPSGYYAYYLYFSSNGGVGPSGSHVRASGRSVRCLRE